MGLTDGPAFTLIVGEGQRHLRHEGDRLLRVEPGDGVADERESQDAAALGRLGGRH
jgi:hypothetical protein